MSVGCDVIAEALNIPESGVRCKSCQFAENFINDMYFCKAWGNQWTRADDFCSFFQRGEKHEHTD